MLFPHNYPAFGYVGCAFLRRSLQIFRYLSGVRSAHEREWNENTYNCRHCLPQKFPEKSEVCWWFFFQVGLLSSCLLIVKVVWLESLESLWWSGGQRSKVTVGLLRQWVRPGRNFRVYGKVPLSRVKRPLWSRASFTEPRGTSHMLGPFNRSTQFKTGTYSEIMVCNSNNIYI